MVRRGATKTVAAEPVMMEEEAGAELEPEEEEEEEAGEELVPEYEEEAGAELESEGEEDEEAGEEEAGAEAEDDGEAVEPQLEEAGEEPDHFEEAPDHFEGADEDEEGSPAAVAPKKKKKARRRAGEAAAVEVAKQQNSVEMLLRKGPFRRLTNVLIADVMETMNVVVNRANRDGRAVLQEATESYLCDVLKDAKKLATYTKRRTMMAKDMTMVESMYKRGGGGD